MKSIREIYKIGQGPSSSHTMGPVKAAKIYLENHPEAKEFVVTLYGSLAATGKGHLTDKAIYDVLIERGPVTFLWEPKTFLPEHPNAVSFTFKAEDGSLQDEWTFYSIGGGDIRCDKVPFVESEDIYPLNKMTDLMKWCNENGRSYWEYVDQYEDPSIWEYLDTVWDRMCKTIENGLENEGVLPGGLKVARRAGNHYVRALGYKNAMRSRGLVFSYSLAVSEENAAGGIIVTAPTCGSCGVVPSVLYHLHKEHEFSRKRIIRSLATAALVGNVVKANASISGAEVGCQGEVGVACAMAAAAATQLFGGSPAQIEYAAEMALEHHLGLTCDPICGLVQIPCIERNAMAAARALDANVYASYTDGLHRVSFDQVVKVMKKTGKDLPSLYKETSEGGLATVVDSCNL
jgi:L-serine dehydratase